MTSHYCDQSGCLRKIFYPYLYCDKHQDNNSTPIPEFKKGDVITLKNFGKADGKYRITDADGEKLSLEAVL